MWNQGEGIILRKLNPPRLFRSMVTLTSAVSLCIFLTGCLSPIAMHRAVLEYDRTVSYVEADLLLLNIARARHHRPVHFTAVSSVAATQLRSRSRTVEKE
jgi:hypothetical protein